MRPTAVAAYVRKLTLAAAGAAAAAPGAAARAPARRPWSVAAVDSALARARAAWEIPGMAVAIVRHDSVLLAKGYGVRELGKPDPVDAETLFDAASLTKSFTSAAVAILVDEGRVRWDDPVRRHLPALELPTPYLSSEVTLRDLLSHRTGLEAANGAWYFASADRAEVLRRMRFLRQAVPFRTGMVYSNVGYTAAGEAAAAAAGTSWEALVRTRLLAPLGMARTTTSYAAAAGLPNVASPHAVVDGAQRPVAREGRGRDVTAPAGAVQSSAADLARWLRFQLAGGVIDGRRVVSEAALAETHAAQVTMTAPAALRRARHVDGPSVAYGMGWQVWDYRGRPLLWHSGSGDGQLAYMALYPADSLGVVVLVNSWVMTSVPPAHGVIAGCVADALLALAPPDCVGDAAARRAKDWPQWQAAERADSAARLPGTRPSRPLASYEGVYSDSLYGPLVVAREDGRLVLRVGERGEIADLTHWHLDTFAAHWRRPFQHAYFATRVTFAVDGAGDVAGLRLRLRSDDVTASRVPAAR